MKIQLLTLLALWAFSSGLQAQDIIPLDTNHWDIQAEAYVLENYKGQQAIYLQRGLAMLKDREFFNGTIEFDIFLTERQSFPGVRFRAVDQQNMEVFYLRPHLSGKPDANQAIPLINGIMPFQLYFGPSYSVAYQYNFDDWTHVKVVVKDRKAQVYLDHAETPQLSWNLVHTPRSGKVAIGGGGAGPMHYANFKISEEAELKDFKVIAPQPIEGLVEEWEISDLFEEMVLDDLSQLEKVIINRKWAGKIQVEEGTAANISRQHRLRGQPGNTVFAKLTLQSEKDQTLLFEFGYSDRVVAILNGVPIYRGNNRWRSRDYRYLGTIGLFDAIYLNLKKGKNTLLFAVSEDFGGWLITGRFKDRSQITVLKE
ncbi:MAG: hypothetical protein AAGG75_10505 [Bacteroidota bacterium]